MRDGLAHEIDAFAPVCGQIVGQHGESVQPDGQIVEILPIAIGRLADTNAPGTPKPGLLPQPAIGLIEEFLVAKFGRRAIQQDEPERIRPQ